jgi:NAD(P)-dependent dehydrogenase (short-subunit alcohol dehydrogenase family)
MQEVPFAVFFDEVFDLNERVPFFISQRALPRIRAVCRIINISSEVTRIAVPRVGGIRDDQARCTRKEKRLRIGRPKPFVIN